MKNKKYTMLQNLANFFGICSKIGLSIRHARRSRQKNKIKPENPVRQEEKDLNDGLTRYIKFIGRFGA